MKWSIAAELLGVLLLASAISAAEPVAWWSFDGVGPDLSQDKITGIQDGMEGNTRSVAGVRGSAVKLDGFTASIQRKASDAPRLEGAFSIECWVALGAYPWNWCPIVTQSRREEAGYRFAVGPKGELALQLAAGGKWLSCTSDPWALPLRKWVFVVATYDSSKAITLYVNGAKVKEGAGKDKLDAAEDTDLRIGMDPVPSKPSHIHREFGTLPSWFSLDGIIDELKIHGSCLSPQDVQAAYDAVPSVGKPELSLRLLPSGPEGPGRFGAYYCKLKYYDGWDDLWSVASEPDVLVRFDKSAARVVFWRGTRYSPAWVSENRLWMADQSVEAWNKTEGCFEHMQDRLCRYAHARVLESHDARVVVHWRYAPVSVNNNLWREDPKTGRACWVDEYYTIYPDVMGIRKVMWKKGTLQGPRQFQESLPFTQPGQLSGDVVEDAFCAVANMEGESITLAFVEKPAKKKEGIPGDLTLQRYNFRAKNDPFIIYEPGNRMHYVNDRDRRGLSRPGACNHWPVGQARCDGRTSQASDRPTHFLGFPISDPPIHEEGGRCWWNGFYGMTERPISALVPVARSWNHPPAVESLSTGFKCQGYDRGQRAYLLSRVPGNGNEFLEFELAAGKRSPLFHPAFLISGWGEARVVVAIDGKSLSDGKSFRQGHRHGIEGTDLVLWMDYESSQRTRFRIAQHSSENARRR